MQLIKSCKDMVNSFNPRKVIDNSRFAVKPFLIISAIYLIGISAIIRANFYYIDDIGRAALGYKGWRDYSRYLTYLLSGFIHADNYLTDISPLTQILAVVILGITSVIAIFLITDKKKITLWELIAIIPLGLSPYFLECISYKFDAPYMALSLLAAVAPIVLYKRSPGYIYILSVFFGTVAVCTTYQAASGVLPMLVALLCLKQWNSGKSLREIFIFIGQSAAGYSIGLLFFKIVIMREIKTNVSGSMPPISQLIPNTAHNFYTYYSHIWTDFKKGWLLLIAIIFVAFICIIVRDSKRNKLLALSMSLLTLIFMLLMSFGIYPLLESTIFEPRAMYGFGVLISFIAVYTVNAKKTLPVKLACLALSWVFFVFSFTYGNALYVQSTYTDYRINAVIDDLDELDVLSSDSIKMVQLSGSIGLSPVLENMPQDYQMLNRLIPVTFRGEWTWGANGFYHFYAIKGIEMYYETDLSGYDLPVLEDSMYHTIRGNEEYILIELK